MISSFCIAVARYDFYRCESDLYIFPMLVVFPLGCGNIRNVLSLLPPNVASFARCVAR